MSARQTTLCVRCGVPAVVWTGHVHIQVLDGRGGSGERMTAGWCRACRDYHSAGRRTEESSWAKCPDRMSGCQGYKPPETEYTYTLDG